MGMFDNIEYECNCPVCHSKVDGFQSKDANCVFETIHPYYVNNFYSICDKCGVWIEFSRKINGSLFNRKVFGKDTELEKYRKKIRILNERKKVSDEKYNVQL